MTDPFDYVEPCESDCTPERHAYHKGQWDMAARICEANGYEPHPGLDTSHKTPSTTPILTGTTDPETKGDV